MNVKGYEVYITCVACRPGTHNIVREEETKAELRRSIRDYFKKPLSYYDIWYLAAEVINDKGDLNPACWGRTRQEAIKKLKNVLK